jgi:alkanesulfonate monooxygenase SsuD/methylene tetrahydromethanopterin reductase-like flavin-dependent oxidoreductase (luciferase family)
MTREEGRDPARLGSALYHNININEDRQAGLEESKTFLDAYYTAKFSPGFVEGWTVAGSPAQCIAELRAYFEAGVGHMGLRLTSWDQRGQLTRFLNEVARFAAPTDEAQLITAAPPGMLAAASRRASSGRP